MKIFLNEHQTRGDFFKGKLFFTSDTHYNHSNICRGTSKWPEGSLLRDFDTLEEMNSTIVNNINEVVDENDMLIHMGDWSFGGFDSIEEFRNQINCKNVHLVLGNHDHHILNNKNNCKKLFSSVNQYLHIDFRFLIKQKVYKYPIICFHYPIASWDNMNIGAFHLHGHVHLPDNSKVSQGKSLDVGVDGNNLKPYEIWEIIEKLENQPIKPLVLPKDHHSQEV